MKIAIINASSQKEKNEIIYKKTLKIASKQGNEVINLGVFPYETCEYSYIQMALCVSILLTSQSADFVITGCSSGTGMMLACNSLPNVLCGYINNPTDAYLFGRINNGNAISFPLGLQYGWAGEINLEYTLEKLFEEPMGIGYPLKDAQRKKKDTELLKSIKTLSHLPLLDILDKIDKDVAKPVLVREVFTSFILENSKNKDIIQYVKTYSE